MGEYFELGGFEVPVAAALVGGLLLLAFGRRLYWLFVAVGGFAVGYWAGIELLAEVPERLVILVAAAAGLLAAVLAVAVQKVAVAVVGFLAAGLAALEIAAGLGYELGPWVWVVAAAAGVIGALLARSLFELALVLLTSIAGAALVSQPVYWPAPQSQVLFLLLAGCGVVFQLFVGGKRS